jgi:hypothetical protein
VLNVIQGGWHTALILGLCCLAIGSRMRLRSAGRREGFFQTIGLNRAQIITAAYATLAAGASSVLFAGLALVLHLFGQGSQVPVQDAAYAIAMTFSASYFVILAILIRHWPKRLMCRG